MDRAEDEVLALFFMFITKVRDVVMVNRPELMKFIKLNDIKLVRDPFGRYFQIILFIGGKQRVTMKELITHFKLRGGTATGIIDELAKRKLLIRESNPSDRRKVELTLTKEGNALYSKAIDIQRDEIRTVLGALDDVEITQLKHILEKVNNALIIKKRRSTESI